MIIIGIVILSILFILFCASSVYLADQFIWEAEKEATERKRMRPEPIPGLTWWELQKCTAQVLKLDKQRSKHRKSKYRIW